MILCDKVTCASSQNFLTFKKSKHICLLQHSIVHYFQINVLVISGNLKIEFMKIYSL